VWRVEELGPSYSGPIVTADRVFITETRGGETEVVRALDRKTGKEVWRAQWPGKGEVPFFAQANGDWIRSTPAYDGAGLFVGGIREVLVSLDAATGEENWRIDFPKKYGTPLPPFGFVSSPLVDGDALYVQAADSLIKVNKITGEVLWRSAVLGGDMTASGAFASPVIATLAGKRQVVIQDRAALRGVDPETGEVLWSEILPSFRGALILPPTVIGDRVFTSAYQNGSRLFEVHRTEEGLKVQPVWQYKASGYMSSPILHGGHAYLHLANGRITAIDLATGEGTWTSEPFGKYWSLSLRGDKILALDAGGELFLLEANPKALTILDRKDIHGDDTWAHLAVSGDEVFVRDLGGLTVYRWQRAKTASR
jgi:outer membrane protein assembly factor BamB